MSLPNPPLYLIADPARCPPGHFLPILQAVLAAGIRWLQLRAKDLDAPEYLALAGEVLQLTRAAEAKLILNGDPAWVAEIGADGVQLSSERLAKLAGQGRQASWGLVGASCHNAEELMQAERLGADFALLSPVFPTASHPGAPALGLGAFSQIVGQAHIPIIALGGITAERIPAVMAAGAKGVAILGGILEAAEPGQAVTAYLGALK